MTSPGHRNPTSGSPGADRTRQQLQELDALLQQMLALPIQETGGRLSEADALPPRTRDFRPPIDIPPAPPPGAGTDEPDAGSPEPLILPAEQAPASPKRPDPLTALLDEVVAKRLGKNTSDSGNPAVKKLHGLEAGRTVDPQQPAEESTSIPPAVSGPKHLQTLGASPTRATAGIQTHRAKSLLTLNVQVETTSAMEQEHLLASSAPSAPEQATLQAAPRHRPQVPEAEPETRTSAAIRTTNTTTRLPEDEEQPAFLRTPTAMEELDPYIYDLSGPATFDITAQQGMSEDPFDLLPAESRAPGLATGPGGPTSRWYRLLVAINTAYDRSLARLGPLGRILTTPAARHILGWLGLVLVLGAGCWALADWQGWWPE